MFSDEREVRAALSCTLEPGTGPINAPATAWREVIESNSALAQAAELLDADRVLSAAADNGIRFIIPGDAEWPTQLDDLNDRPEVRGIGGLPWGLWVQGEENLAEITASAIAVTGSRAATTYGEVVATELGSDLSEQGWTVVAGGAFGIDAAAHRAALSVDGPTVVVLPSGIDIAYPPAHKALITTIAQRGLVVSELPPGNYPTRTRMEARGRVVAALSKATVLVQAGARSGALNQVAWAENLNRLVMAVPGPTTSAQSYSPHRLIQEGRAALVTGSADVLQRVEARRPQPWDIPHPERGWEHVQPPTTSPKVAHHAMSNGQRVTAPQR